MPRPDFPFPGYWMGINGSIQVHMGPSNIPNREKYYIGTPVNAVDGQTGVIDHVAFLAEEPAGFIEKFIKIRLISNPVTFQSQIFINFLSPIQTG